MQPIVVYTRRWCGYCTAAKSLLDDKGYPFEEIAADNDPALRDELERRSGQSTLPQIFVGDQSIGGYRELALLMARGEFEELLAP
ncbi:MAG: glutaredoxin 3 [Proteobacteria bacterium]|jgi:glutaredoxin 3|nr:glutaredoxin 3 [Pseudomonadota bacterium]MDA0926652.1 glutaredoxin 3 [Pseudomonadota bacterium]